MASLGTKGGSLDITNRQTSSALVSLIMPMLSSPLTDKESNDENFVLPGISLERNLVLTPSTGPVQRRDIVVGRSGPPGFHILTYA